MQMIASAVQEDRDEISFTLTFGLRRGKDQFGGPKLGMSTNNGYHTRRVERNHYSRHSDDESKNVFISLLIYFPLSLLLSVSLCLSVCLSLSRSLSVSVYLFVCLSLVLCPLDTLGMLLGC